MPVPKGRQKAYGVMVGHLQNEGMGMAAAKAAVDKAMKDHPDLTDKKFAKYGKKKKGMRKAKKAAKKPKKGMGKKMTGDVGVSSY